MWEYAQTEGVDGQRDSGGVCVSGINGTSLPRGVWQFCEQGNVWEDRGAEERAFCVSMEKVQTGMSFSGGMLASGIGTECITMGSSMEKIIN